MLVYACTTNVGKLQGLLAAVKKSEGSAFDLRIMPGLAAIVPPEETGTTFEENAALKAKYYSGFTDVAVLCDDSGIEVDALYGAPGVLSARYAGPGASDEDNNNLLLSTLSNAAVRTARYICVVALAQSGVVLQTAHGKVEGEILVSPRGKGGFGYDPLFYYPPLQRSFAELTQEEKLGISHRGGAMQALLQRLPTRRPADYRRQ